MRPELFCGTAVFVALIARTLAAAPITYQVEINTSSISGTLGSLDLNFNPGPLVAQAASLQILDFSANGSLVGSPLLIGDVSGQLPSTVTFDNATAFSDYFQEFRFDSAIQLEISLFGPALNSPNGSASSGSTFAFSMFSNPGGTIPVLTTNTSEGFAFLIDVNLDGTTTAVNFSPETAIATAIPEPRILCLISLGICAMTLIMSLPVKRLLKFR